MAKGNAGVSCLWTLETENGDCHKLAHFGGHQTNPTRVDFSVECMFPLPSLHSIPSSYNNTSHHVQWILSLVRTRVAPIQADLGSVHVCLTIVSEDLK